MTTKSNIEKIFDIIIIGAGPSGICAALQTKNFGLKVGIIDDQSEAGGQFYRNHNLSIKITKKEKEQSKGDTLRKKLSSSNIVTFFGYTVWHIEKRESEYIIYFSNQVETQKIKSKKLILALGARERIFPVKGWTKPNVIGLAAATALLKQHHIITGKKIVLAGSGPLLLYVANAILKKGGNIEAIVDYNPLRKWLFLSFKMILKPIMALKGLSWIYRIQKSKIPVFYGYQIKEIKGDNSANEVILSPLTKDLKTDQCSKELSITADSICLGHGLTCSHELVRQLDLNMEYTTEKGGWVPQVDYKYRTSDENIYICGDGSRIEGVDSAELSGKLASISAMEDLGVLSKNKRRNYFYYYSLKRFIFKVVGEEISKLSTLSPQMLDNLKQDTIICRCEEVNMLTIMESIPLCNTNLNALKASTRAGMGPCGGRFCMENIAMIVAQKKGKAVREIALPTVRSPIKPIPICAITSSIDNYDEISPKQKSPL